MSQDSGISQPNRYATFNPRPSRHSTTGGRVTSFAYKKGRSSTVPVLRCLETKEMQRLGVQCSGSWFPSSVLTVSPHDGCTICLCRQGLYQEAHNSPVTDTVHATKQRCRGSLRHYISRVLQSPLPCPRKVRRLDTSHRPLISQLLPRDSTQWRVRKAFGDLSLETPWSLPSILWMPISTYPSTEVTDNFYDFRLGTPYTNPGHCRLAFLQHLGYSSRL